MKTIPTVQATVIYVDYNDGRAIAKCGDGSTWCIPEEHIENLYEGDVVLVKIHDRQDQYCTFVGKASKEVSVEEIMAGCKIPYN